MNTYMWAILTGLPLLICSIAAVSLIIERAWFLSHQRDMSQQKYEQILKLLASTQVVEAIEEIVNEKPFYQPAIELVQKPQLSEKSIRDDEISTLMVMFNSRLKKRLSGLVTISALAPMLGLLGTIVGLMRAFKNIGEHTGPVEPSLVADGLWQALSTTAIGLVIAVFCILAHAIFVSKIKNMLTRSQYLLNTISQSLYQKHLLNQTPESLK